MRPSSLYTRSQVWGGGGRTSSACAAEAYARGRRPATCWQVHAQGRRAVARASSGSTWELAGTARRRASNRSDVVNLGGVVGCGLLRLQAEEAGGAAVALPSGCIVQVEGQEALLCTITTSVFPCTCVRACVQAVHLYLMFLFLFNEYMI